ncbi:MAG TPA: M23 family metallopeptidase [Longimicrobiaceae bacterium]|jgi:murein DD-endopeptidase MepM/ murein hydrolase activator NlpD|nr:M23 family metallopeptidase [Longimicrobiaceae bacterium]
MALSRWTLVLVPHDNESVRSFQISAKAIRAALAVLVMGTVTLGTFSIGFFVKQGQSVRAGAIAHENELLAAEVDQMRGQMLELNRSIETLSKKDESYRVIAGLPRLDAAAQRAGLGTAGEPRSGATGLRYLDRRLGGKVYAASSDLGTLIRRATLLRSSMDQAISALQSNHERLASMPSIAPSTGPLTSPFSTGRYHPVLHITRPHKGIDIAARVGEPILAPARGVVRFAGNRSNGYGNMVEIDHGFGYITRFAHASKLLVHDGQTVQRGQVIALVGATGLVSGPHLHYEVEVNGRQVDPMNFIVADAIPE